MDGLVSQLGYETPPPAPAPTSASASPPKPREGSPGSVSGSDGATGSEATRLLDASQLSSGPTSGKATPTAVSTAAAAAAGPPTPADLSDKLADVAASPAMLVDGSPSESLDYAKKEILDKFFDDKGNYKYIYFIEDSESDSESDEEYTPGKTQTGGVEEEQRTKYQRIETAYAKSLSEDDKNALLGNDLGADVAETIQLILSNKDLAMLGLERKHWEVPNPTQQCITAGIAPGRPCWLCGNPVNMGYGGANVKGKRMSVCSPDDNQYECEHVLPGAFMLFLKKMINNMLGDQGRDAAIEAKLYDSSCHICNTTKSDGVYIRAKWVGGGSAAAAAAGERLEFSPHNEKIMVDILTFILSTRIGQTVELNRYKEVESGRSTGRESATAKFAAREAARQAVIREDQERKPICSNRDAVVSYVAKMSGGERVISRSTFTSITTVAEDVNEDTLKAITDALPPRIEGEVRNTAAKSAETAVAFTIAPRFNNLTRAVIEQITPADITAAGAIRFESATHIRMDMFNFLTTEKGGKPMGENTTFDKLFKVPAPPAPSAVPGVAAAPAAVVDLAAGSEDDTAAPTPLRMSSEAKEHLAALRTAKIPMSVDREKAWAWIRTRYMAIWTRMNELCGILNRDHKQIETSAHSLAKQPLLTLEDIDTLDVWSKVVLPGEAASRGKRARSSEGGFRFTVHRRSETRQTKKNRRRKVIEVNV